MKNYPKIEYHNKGPFGEECIAFDKLDGSNLRFEWSHKRGWYKFGSRNVMIDKNNEQFGIGIEIFLNKYGEELDQIFRTKYKKVPNFVVFGEFYGENSFAGQHLDSDIKDVVLFDVNQYQRGFIDPNEFIKNFGHLHIPNIIYEGKYNNQIINDVQSNKFNLSEGVIVKGIQGKETWMVKIKTNTWLNKVRQKMGDKALLDELNGDTLLFSKVI